MTADIPSNIPDPERVVLTLPDLRRLTILERARAAAVVGVAERELGTLLRSVTSGDADPEQVTRGIELLYAMAWQLRRRTEPGATWATAQTWDVVLDLDGPPDPIAEAEATASVEAAIATGLPPSVAGDLTLAQLDAYAHVRREAARPRRRGRRR